MGALKIPTINECAVIASDCRKIRTRSSNHVICQHQDSADDHEQKRRDPRKPTA